LKRNELKSHLRPICLFAISKIMTEAIATFYQTGAEAIQQQRYSDAVMALESFCQSYQNTNAKAYFQARMWLVEAYCKTGNLAQAEALCRQLLAPSNPQAVQTWANRILPKLSSTAHSAAPASPGKQASASTAAPGHQSPLATDEAAEESASNPFLLSAEEALGELKAAQQDLKYRRYDRAVPKLESLVGNVQPSWEHYGQAMLALADAYRGNQQIEEATAVCEELSHFPDEAVQARAYQLRMRVSNMAASPSPTAATSSPTAATAEPTSTTAAAHPVDASRASNTFNPSKPQSQSATTNDLTPQILSVLSHGAISPLGPLAVQLFLPREIAGVLALFLFVVPLTIFLVYRDRYPIVADNSKEALNYVITSILLVMAAFGGAILVTMIALAMPELLLLLAVVLGLWFLAYSLLPIVALVYCFIKPDQPFRYPKWFVVHLL
jgi:outer membrane protein assembly factor BamD (BamD/ComL family)/uncharacterized Tic20 family protein